MFACKIFKISKKSFFTEHLPWLFLKSIGEEKGNEMLKSLQFFCIYPSSSKDCFYIILTGQQIITTHILPNISRSEGNKEMKFGQLIKYSIRNETGGLVPELFLLFKKALYKVKASGQHFSFEMYIILWFCLDPIYLFQFLLLLKFQDPNRSSHLQTPTQVFSSEYCKAFNRAHPDDCFCSYLTQS